MNYTLVVDKEELGVGSIDHIHGLIKSRLASGLEEGQSLNISITERRVYFLESGGYYVKGERYRTSKDVYPYPTSNPLERGLFTRQQVDVFKEEALLKGFKFNEILFDDVSSQLESERAVSHAGTAQK